MNLFDIISKWAGLSGSKLAEFLERVATDVPDLAVEARQYLDALRAAGTIENLVNLAEVLPGEIANIAQGKFDPRDQPSNLI